MSFPSYTYKTITLLGEGSFFDRGSKFLSFAFPVNDVDQIKTELRKLKEQHPKADHFCYAWRLGTNGNDFRVNDNGEPSGSAGRPILGQIDSHEITNILIVVIRYFGGTLLGIPGLINAYKTAAAASLSNISVIEKPITEAVQAGFEYTSLNLVMRLIRKYDAVILAKKEELFCDYLIAIPLNRKEEFLKEIAQYPDLKINMTMSR